MWAHHPKPLLLRSHLADRSRSCGLRSPKAGLGSPRVRRQVWGLASGRRKVRVGGCALCSSAVDACARASQRGSKRRDLTGDDSSSWGMKSCDLNKMTCQEARVVRAACTSSPAHTPAQICASGGRRTIHRRRRREGRNLEALRRGRRATD